ncbi:MAG: hypothetical protein A3C35_03430 [Omnitrophica bacterium RIFCSPHIGHO2_02_FULL_46_11]|nr:MAG: hypothetical protein A3A81_05020 [Omnitrophica bacterium RIFCSPLOWO2_01_FULL_45_10b]OGW85781.1 MAG: hypothetical protein A3C35_03430 [Omnitrophica bacterium RIFCSPHIGHO2_02_FULL_46_11]
MQIKIPFLAEGVHSGTVVSILVKEGDHVKKEQTVLELETNKATAPIPSPASGTITKILVKEGVEISVGQAIMSLSEEGAAKEPAKGVGSKPAQEKEAPTITEAGDASEEYTYESKSGALPPASPSVRKMALELGIDLTKIRGTERGGRITVKDLKAYVQRLKAGSPQKSEKPAPVSIDFSKWGPVNRKPVSSTRRTIGQKMYESWTTIPHVTQFDEADITALLELRKKYAPSYEKKGARLTVTGILLKVAVQALKKFPIFNSSLDESKNELVCKHYYHLGVAVDTEQGLLVPILKDADKKSLLDLSIELAQLSEKARQRKISLEDVQGGTFTISNLGSIGGGHFTPIVNKPEVAILGVGRGIVKPIVKDGKIQTRTMLSLGLSYDHRVVDGADGARFIHEMVQGLEHFKEEYFTIRQVEEKKTAKKTTQKVKR